MARLTEISAIDMSCTLATGNDTVMADHTGLLSGAVIKGGYVPGRYRMAGIAGQRCGQVILALTDGDDAVMTTFAGADNLVVIYHRRR